jgi:hypothetical protein
MKIKIKVKSGPFGRYKLHEVIEIGEDCVVIGKHLKDTPARHAYELELKLNGGLTVHQAEGLHARTGQHNAPIYFVEAWRDTGTRIW